MKTIKLIDLIENTTKKRLIENTTQNIRLDWNLCDGLNGDLPNADEEVLTLCENDGEKFFRVQHYSKNHGYWTESPFVVAWCELPEFPNL